MTLEKYKIMGLYDDIKSKYLLPKPENPKGYIGSNSFQTKDLGSSMDLYEILEDGTIWKEKRSGEWVQGNPKSKSFSGKLGYFKTTAITWEQVFLSDTINIYDYQNTDGEFDYSIEYSITFRKGIIKDVSIFEFDAIPNTERKEKEKQRKQEMKERMLFEATLKYKILYRPWNKLIRFLFLKTHNTCNFVSSNLFKVERKLII